MNEIIIQCHNPISESTVCIDSSILVRTIGNNDTQIDDNKDDHNDFQLTIFYIAFVNQAENNNNLNYIILLIVCSRNKLS